MTKPNNSERPFSDVDTLNTSVPRVDVLNELTRFAGKRTPHGTMALILAGTIFK